MINVFCMKYDDWFDGWFWVFFYKNNDDLCLLYFGVCLFFVCFIYLVRLLK